MRTMKWAALLAAALILTGCGGRPAHELKNGVKIQFLGHSAFRIDTPTGKTILIDPWLQNPQAPAGVYGITKADYILITHGHQDHIGNAVDIQKITGGKVICLFETGLYLNNLGVNNYFPLNYGGALRENGIEFTMVEAVHSTGIIEGGHTETGGGAVGFIIRLENGFTIYNTGDTDVFGDMKLISEMHKPDVVMLPIGDAYTMGPKGAAKAAELILARYIIPMHYGTWPALTGTPAAFRKELRSDLQSHVVELAPGEVLQ